MKQKLKKKLKKKIEEKIEEKNPDKTENQKPENNPNPDSEPSEIKPESTADIPQTPEHPAISSPDKLSRTERERLLLERRRSKQQQDHLPADKHGKSRLEYFDIYSIVDAVEKHNGCLNPEASESEKKWLHDYFLQVLKIPMVLTTIKVLPVRLNLRGTGVPYTWK